MICASGGGDSFLARCCQDDPNSHQWLFVSDILIVTHRDDRAIDEPGYYTITILVKLWRQMGLRVSLVKGPSRFGDIDATAAINHVDLTVTPARYLAYLKRFSTVINGGL